MINIIILLYWYNNLIINSKHVIMDNVDGGSCIPFITLVYIKNRMTFCELILD